MNHQSHQQQQHAEEGNADERRALLDPVFLVGGRRHEDDRVDSNCLLVRLSVALVFLGTVMTFLFLQSHSSHHWWFTPVTLPKRVPSSTNNDLGHVNKDSVHTVQDVPGFFGYSPPPPPLTPTMIQVTYDHRSIRINQQPILLLGGSLHPVRHSPATWQKALNSAVDFGLNLVTIYVMWSAHQPFSADQAFDWRLPASELVCADKDDDGSAVVMQTSRKNHVNHSQNDDDDDDECWTLATAIQEAARRRLWVHLRIGPYVCAEYNYGGIPEWVAQPASLSKNFNKNETMSMRRPNRPWLQAMQTFVQNVTQYISSHHLWAHEGGNILMGQIENELQGEIDEHADKNILWVSADGKFVDEYQPGSRRASMQDYANWCGKLAHSAEPQVIWTMCQGLSAPNTISTFNGVDGSDWLDHQTDGNKGVQVDYPALFTGTSSCAACVCHCLCSLHQHWSHYFVS